MFLFFATFSCSFASIAHGGCPTQDAKLVYADMHDGAKKEVTISGTSVTIKPSGNNQKWEVISELDPSSCSALINFTVPGKPNPPPVNLQANLWMASSYKPSQELFWGFTDPSGTLAAKDVPLNRWVPQTVGLPHPVTLKHCPCNLKRVYADMHDGDKKEVSIEGVGGCYKKTLTIKPSGNNQTWVVKADMAPMTCTASIDFRVPGKPGPPPVKLQMTLYFAKKVMDPAGDTVTEFEFTDPSGKLAPASFPLNHWVEISSGSEEPTLI